MKLNSATDWRTDLANSTSKSRKLHNLTSWVNCRVLRRHNTACRGWKSCSAYKARLATRRTKES